MNRHRCDAIIARRLVYFLRDGWVRLELFDPLNSRVLSLIALFDVRFSRPLLALGS
jgi:hypothetical protein